MGVFLKVVVDSPYGKMLHRLLHMLGRIVLQGHLGEQCLLESPSAIALALLLLARLHCKSRFACVVLSMLALIPTTFQIDGCKPAFVTFCAVLSRGGPVWAVFGLAHFRAGRVGPALNLHLPQTWPTGLVLSGWHGLACIRAP